MHSAFKKEIRAVVYTLIGILLISTAWTEPASAQSTPGGIAGLQIDASDENDNIRPITHITSQGYSTFLCEGLSDPRCPTMEVSATANLLPCSEQVTLGCVMNLYSVNGAGERTNAQFIRIIEQDDKKNDFSQQLDRNLVAGAGVGSVWKIPGVTHGGGTNLFTLNAFLVGSSNFGSDFFYDNFQFSITAVTELPGNYSGMVLGLREDRSIEGMGRVTGSSCQGTIAQDEKGCFTRQPMPKETRFGVEVLLPNALSGWFHGRIFKPEISAEPLASNRIRYQIEAEPVKVPILNDFLPQSSWSADFKQFVDSRWPIAHSAQLMPGSSGNLAFELASRYLPMIDDRASSSGDFWNVKSLGGWNSVERKVFDCSADKKVVSGIVTTNAMVYTASPPIFNRETQTLDYRVLSPHLDETGKENLGSYDLLINSKVARCIYGFSNAPVQAAIEVLGSDGSSKVATTVLAERGDWIFLSANGFTYSEPVVRVKLTQESQQISNPSPTSSTAVSKKVTIICKKGLSQKRISGLKPKCPKGFKKR